MELQEISAETSNRRPEVILQENFKGSDSSKGIAAH